MTDQPGTATDQPGMATDQPGAATGAPREGPAGPLAEPPAGPANWNLRRRLGRTFALFGVVLLVLGALTVVFLLRYRSAGDAVINRWQPAAMSSQRLVDDLRGQAGALRGYAQDGETYFRENYDTFRKSEDTDVADVRHLAGSDREVVARLETFTTKAGLWRRTIADVVIADVKARAGAVGTKQGLTLLNQDSTRQLFADGRDAATDLLGVLDRRAESERHRRSTYADLLVAALAAGALAILVVGFVTWRGLHRWVLGPVDRLRAQTRTVAAGATHRQIVPDGPEELATLGADVEAMRRQIAEQLAHAELIQDELSRRGAELARSNADLQQFAYVASHDLSEPLRKVSNFCQLLERQYGDRLDERARQYIDFAVDGARRMQVLIADLLALSRVGRSTDAFVPVDLTVAVAQAEANLSYKITEAGATVRYGRLPVVPGDPVLLGSLLENLLGNAIKYRADDVAPVVSLAAEHDSASASWEFTVTDNGIGIEPQYAERVFAVFQRLHLRDQYGGTGIGLALCRKIVEFHGGRIWLDTDAPGPGATFRFTLPEGAAGRDG